MREYSVTFYIDGTQVAAVMKCGCDKRRSSARGPSLLSTCGPCRSTQAKSFFHNSTIKALTVQSDGFETWAVQRRCPGSTSPRVGLVESGGAFLC